jgi:hypothetical protein
MRNHYGSAEDVAVGGCIRSAMEIAHELGHNEVSLCFDAGRIQENRTTNSLLDITTRAESGHSGPVRLQPILFGEVRKVLALQGADTIALETKWYAEEILCNQDAIPQVHFRRMLETIHARGFILDRTQIQKDVNDFKQFGPRVW